MSWKRLIPAAGIWRAIARNLSRFDRISVVEIPEDELRRAIAMLETVVADRAAIASAPEELRTALMAAAGRFSRPNKLEFIKEARAIRKVKKAKIALHDKAVRNAVEIRAARQAEVYIPPDRAQDGPERVLKTPRYCYVCKAPFTRLHFFYDSMCPDCAAFNYEKRFQSADLSGMTALVTGSRVKIGFQIGLKLLRAGARVIATTRFPHDSALRYSREEDFGSWKDRLQVHGLDLRHSPSVELFARYVNQTEKRLDILVNNACQTVRRPPQWYAHLLADEMNPAGPELAPLLASHEGCKRALGFAPFESEGRTVETGLILSNAKTPGVGIAESAKLSQLRYAYDEEACPPGTFPLNRTDADLQQVDLRTRNTWRLKLSEVATPEMLEVHLINAVAPFILCGKLKPLMARSPSAVKHIVNVSAMEGSFSRHTKTDKHPHTNMAKAALNMMTLTSAPDYAKDGIHMNAVDTGWVTDEDPALHAERKKEELDFQPPLDIVDGAARVLDPVFAGHNTGEPAFGKFFKDYKPTEW
ncbi:MAG: SDR family oxidoreductase [Elusimicrobia bacterium]|nr:SDR family oxidoreductase [Elusimicrobiota bacterium]